MKKPEISKSSLTLKRRRISYKKHRSVSPNNPLHTTTYTTSTIKQREEILETSAQLQVYCEPGSGDYNIPRAFEKVKE